MFRRILFSSLIIVLAGAVLKGMTLSRAALASPVTVKKQVAQQALEATVRITMYAPLTDEEGNPRYVRENGQRAIQLTVSEGLGTLARQGSDLLIVTHDHWHLVTPDLRRVAFHDAGGEPLLELSGKEFLQLVRYRDGGTMVLTAPTGLAASRVPVALDNGSGANRDDIVYLAFRDPDNGQIGVAAMLVQKETIYQGRPVSRLTSLNGELVVEGNSGGGVLYNGKLIGNMWGTIMVEDVSAADASSPQQTSFSLAAQLPAEIGSQRNS